MTRIRKLTLAGPIVAATLLSFACSRSSDQAAPAKAREPAPPQRSARALAEEWTFGPQKDQKVQSYGSFFGKSGDNLVVASMWLRDQGKAREWMARASAFYSKKCGSGQDPVRIHAETGKHQLGINGESKNQGRYVIDEPGLMLMPIALIPPRPLELVFACHDADSTVTAVLWQQGDDAILISVTAAVR